jgi:hypothetical protein
MTSLVRLIQIWKVSFAATLTTAILTAILLLFYQLVNQQLQIGYFILQGYHPF